MDIDKEVDAICAEFMENTRPNGRIGLAARNLQSGAQILVQAHENFPSASTIKLPVLITLMAQVEQGAYALDDPLMLRRADKTGGSGLLQYLTPGLTLTIRDWAFLMMNISDNTATNVLIDQVGLPNVQQWLADNGYDDVMLYNKINLPSLAHDLYHFGTASPFGLMKMITAVFQHEVLAPACCDEMLRMMNGVGKERVGRYLPFEPFGTKLPKSEQLQIAGKTGSFKGARAQTAVIWRGEGEARCGYALAVMTDGDPAPEIWSADAAGVLVIGRIARALLDWGMA